MGDLPKGNEAKAVEKGENPGLSLEDLLAALLITLLTNVVNKVITELSTRFDVRKLFGGKGPE